MNAKKPISFDGRKVLIGINPVTGKQAADVCVLVCGQEIRVHRIERDDELIERLIDLAIERYQREQQVETSYRPAG